MRKSRLKMKWLSLALVLVASLVALSLSPRHASAALAFDQNLGFTDADNVASNTIVLTTAATAASNSLIILAVNWDHATFTLSSVSGGSLTWAIDAQFKSTLNNHHIALVSAQAPSGLASGTNITATFSGSAGRGWISGMSITGAATSSVLDNTNHSDITATNAWTSSVNTTATNTFVVGAASIDNTTTSTATAPNVAVHQDNNANYSGTFVTAYQIASSAGSKTVNGGFGAVGSGVETVAAYKAVSNTAPAAPTLSSPASAATGIPVQPVFNLSTTDAESDYLQYYIKVYDNSGGTGLANCNADSATNLVRSIDQSSSQTGWSGQNAGPGGNTAYTGSSTISGSTMAVHTYQPTALSANTLYYWKGRAIDAGGSAGYGSYSSCQSFTTSQAPATPTLITPASSSSGNPTLPIFQLRTSDADSDYLQYFIQLYDATACGGSQVGSDIDQTASQTNWQGQDASSGTAYLSSSTLSNSSIARYQYSGTALTPGHLYSWRAKAKDPSGSQTFSSLSSCQDFTIGASEVEIQGGTQILGGTLIQ